MQIQGKIILALPETTGTSTKGNAWRKREYVLETLEQYPKKIHFSIMNDRIDQLGGILFVGNNVKVDIDIQSREYQGRWYTSINAWGAAPLDQQQSAAPTPTPTPTPGAYPPPPYGAQPVAAPAPQYPANNPYGDYQRPQPKPVPDGQADDLPF